MRETYHHKITLNPDVADEAPQVEFITPYDEAHFVTYVRLLDAELDEADWREISRVVLHRNPDNDVERTRRCWESHLSRARWMTEQGYRYLQGQ